VFLSITIFIISNIKLGEKPLKGISPERDAIHVAIALVIAGEELKPGNR
jgi:hypothetical protein